MNAKQTATSLIITMLTCISGLNDVSGQTSQELASLEHEAMARIESERATAKTADEGNRWAFTTPDGTYQELAFVLDGVPVFRKTANLKESDLIHATQPRNELSLWGRNVRIGLWDNGRAYSHREFSERLSTADQPGGFPGSSHATHVAGTLVASGLDPEATGIAPEASVVSYDWRFDYTEMWTEAQQGLRVSNHSYSFAAGWEKVYDNGSFMWTYRNNGDVFGEYGVAGWFWDDVMNQNPHYLIVKAAGNEAGQGPESGNATAHYHDSNTSELHFDQHPKDCATGYGCLGSLSSSKNALVVGALDADGTGIADFSSRGPTLDGRLKPDVVSAGTGVYSTIGGDGYGVSSGTSMASPTVAGSVALMLELEQRLFGADRKLRASTLKALLIHGADDLGNPGPDYLHGWGRVNVEATLDLMVRSTGTNVAILEPELTDELVLDFYSPGSDFKVTLSWIDPKGPNPNTVVDKSRPVLMEDVDLVVEKDGATYHPYILDPVNPESPARTGVNSVDNVEQIDLGSLPAGPVTVVLRRKGGSGEALPVSLVVSGTGDRSPVSNSDEELPGAVRPIAVFPNPARPGQRLNVSGGSIDTQEIDVELIDATGRVVAGLGGGITDRIDSSWTLPDQISAGLYFVRIRGERFHETASIMIAR